MDGAFSSKNNILWKNIITTFHIIARSFIQVLKTYLNKMNLVRLFWCNASRADCSSAHHWLRSTVCNNTIQQNSSIWAVQHHEMIILYAMAHGLLFSVLIVILLISPYQISFLIFLLSHFPRFKCLFLLAKSSAHYLWWTTHFEATERHLFLIVI